METKNPVQNIINIQEYLEKHHWTKINASLKSKLKTNIHSIWWIDKFHKVKEYQYQSIIPRVQYERFRWIKIIKLW